MGLGAGIIAGAMQGVGDGMQQVADQKAKLWGQEEINQQMSDLAVQRQAAQMALQFQQKQRAMEALYPNGQSLTAPASPATPATPAASAPSMPTAVSWTGAPTPAPAANSAAPQDYADHPGLDPSKHSPQELAYLQKTYPDAFTNGVSHFAQWQQANSPGIAANNAPAPGGAPVVWKPSHELMQAAMSADIITPGAGAKLLEANAPDPTGKALLAQGIAPGSKAWNDAYAAHMFKENSENVRPGGIVTVGGKPVFAAPSEGVQTTFDDQGHPTANVVPGYAGAKATVAAATLAATNSQTLAPTDRSPVDAQGRAIPTSIAAALANGGAGQGAGLSPGQQALIASNADAAKANVNLPNVANSSKQSRTGLENALKILDTVKATGPGTAISAEIWSKLANTIPGINMSTPDSDKYQLLLKYLNNSLATSSAVTGANGSDARFEQFSHGQPNGETMNVGPLRQALQYTLSQHDATIAGASFIQKARDQLAKQGVPNPDQVAQQAWSNIYNPRAFELNRLAPKEQAELISNLSPAEAQKLRAQRDAMAQAKVFQ